MYSNGEFTDSPSALDLVPDHIREIWDNRIYGDEEHIQEGYFELTHSDGDVSTPICGKDKFLLIKGREKTRKSLFSSCLLSGAFTDDIRHNLGFTFTLKEDECILHFDTEMDAHELKWRKIMFNRIAGINPRNEQYQLFAIRNYSHKQRAEMITHVIENCGSQIGKTPAIILIDQVKHLLPSVDTNDTASISIVYEWFLAWMRMSRAMMMAVMHTNRAGKETDGMLGKTLDQMLTASFLIEYEHSTGITSVTQDRSRKKPINKIKFMQDDRGLPRLLTYQDIF